MYYLDTKDGPSNSLYPKPFQNRNGVDVIDEDFLRPADERMALGIWPLENDERPDENDFDVIGEEYEHRESVVVRHWLKQPKSAADLAAAQAAALKATRTSAVAEIDAQAGIERTRYITIAPGQELTYVTKQQQAAAFQVDPEPSQEKYPLIYAEIGITGDNPQAVAVAVLDAAHAWGLIGSAIEAVRLSAKQAVAAAADIAAIDVIIQNLTWPEEAD